MSNNLHIETLVFEFYKFFRSSPQNEILYFHTLQITAMWYAIMKR